MEQETKNVIALLLNVLLLPGLGTAAHGEKRRGIIQIAGIFIAMFFVIIAPIFPAIEYKSMIIIFVIIASLIASLMWAWALLDGVAFVQNREEFYIFKNLK